MKLTVWIPVVAAVNNGWALAALALVLAVWLYVRKVSPNQSGVSLWAQ
jgi:hypothetical protein